MKCKNQNSARSDAAIRIAVQDRLDAGFTQEEIDEIASLSAGGPSKDTLQKASKILRERHKSRREGAGRTAAE